ncbi:hypothetical protein MPER_00592 [Moniliophthora perniciosa FA553]|nr:hypothetical protein MPER_00592 [Moniliophthora perniciosa FA553]
MLSNASNIAIAGKATLNNVGGNQYNHSVQVRLQRGRERAVAKRRRKAESGVYSQFREIIHGDLFLREEFSTCYYWKEEPEKEGRTRLRNRFNGNAQKTVYAADMYTCE